MGDLSRRSFLAALGLAGLGLGGCSRAASQAPANPIVPGSTAQPGEPRVVVVRVGNAWSDAAKLRSALDRGMQALTGAPTPTDAWKRLFTPHDVVAMKANALAGPKLSTHPEVCYAIAASLASAGVAPDRTVVYDRLSEELEVLGFTLNEGGPGMKVLGSDATGYDQEPTEVRSVGTCFSRIISEAATAIINVPVLKDHDLAGLSGALKNHYGSIHNPNKLHTDHCHPYVADLNCAQLLREKQRLIVFDALQVCYDGGPAFSPGATVPYGALLLSTDAVAADAVGLGIIEKLRADAKLPALMSLERAPRYIHLAGEYGIGTADLELIETIEV